MCCKVFSPYGNAKEFCQHLFRTFDKDKNGYIDFVEFMLAINITGKGTAEEKLVWSFKIYDIDGNGMIDVNEMAKVVESIYAMLGPNALTMTDVTPEDRAKSIFQQLDKNGDDMLTQREFVSGCLRDRELRNMLSLTVNNSANLSTR